MGVKELTRDHDIIFCLLDELSNYALTKPQNETMRQHCAEMIIHYCAEHFSWEEAEMRSCGFPHYEAHRKEHEHVQEALRSMTYGLSCSNLLELLDFLRNTVIRHIITWDEVFLTWERELHTTQQTAADGESPYWLPSLRVSLAERRLLLNSGGPLVRRIPFDDSDDLVLI